MSRRELFELSLYGGAPEKQYRRARPDVERLAWGSLPDLPLSDAHRVHARDSWTRAAIQEYASAAVHGANVRELVRARVPLDLCAIAARLPLDELVHAELCARVATELGGGTPVEYDPAQLFPERRSASAEPEMAAMEHVVADMCVSESFSFAMLRHYERAARHPLIKGVWRIIARDEARHARLGWVLLEWIAGDLGLREKEMLGAAARGVLQALRQGAGSVAKLPDGWFSELSVFAAFGDPGGRERYAAVAERALDEHVIRPLARFGIEVD
jgi:hypothetical protein